MAFQANPAPAKTKRKNIRAILLQNKTVHDKNRNILPAKAVSTINTHHSSGEVFVRMTTNVQAKFDSPPLPNPLNDRH